MRRRCVYWNSTANGGKIDDEELPSTSYAIPLGQASSWSLAFLFDFFIHWTGSGLND